MDMSRAFDTVDRNLLMNDLESILEEDELHMIKILLENVSLVVKCGDTLGEEFVTDMGSPQGDCISPILFTLYLARALVEDVEALAEEIEPSVELADHMYNTAPNTTPSLTDTSHDHAYSHFNHRNKMRNESEENLENLELQYADDINYICENYAIVEAHKRAIPPKLEKRKLLCNHSKDEEYRISRRKYDPSQCVNCSACGRCGDCKKCKECMYCKDWKNCKCLGSMIDTSADIKRRKSLSIDAMNKLKQVWKNKRVKTCTKLKIFNAYITSIFLYNSELWSLNSSLEGAVDAFQRRLLRKMLNITWPKKISNEKLSNITKAIPWSKVIANRRLRWFGHLVRLPEGAPAKLALKEAERDAPMPRGRRKTIWLEVMKKQLTTLEFTYTQAKSCAQDRDYWRQLCWKTRPQWEKHSRPLEQ